MCPGELHESKVESPLSTSWYYDEDNVEASRTNGGLKFLPSPSLVSAFSIRLAGKMFEFHLPESRLHPIDKNLVERLTSNWSRKILSSLSSQMQPCLLPVVFYVSDKRAELEIWDLAVLQKEGLAYRSAFRRQVYLGVQHHDTQHVSGEGMYP